MKKSFILMGLLVGLIFIYQSCKKEESKEEPVVVETIEYNTFNKEHIAFGKDLSQTVKKSFTMHPEAKNIDKIKMFVILECPTGGCNEWDVYANIKVKDQVTGIWHEIGRYITPYGIDNSALPKGFEIDVTDFKSLLHGEVELQARIETWGADGWNLTLNFEVTTGVPDYQYYSVARVLAYDAWSSKGVPYGVLHSNDLDKTITIPANAKSASFRTILSGWGHATPMDNGVRGCAEWCFRRHHIKINNANTFEHYMGPIGCADNPVKNQKGNWQPDRAGWCPGMAVPVRLDSISSDLYGKSFNFEYDYEDWIADNGSSKAYNATSCFVIAKSDEPIEPATILD